MTGRKTRILLADDHAVVRQGFARIMQGEADLEVVGEASDGREAVQKAIELKPDLVIMDLSMPGMNGMDAVREIKDRMPEVKALVLTVHAEEEYVLASLPRD